MKFKIIQYGENVYANYWLYPLVMSLLAIAVACGSALFDNYMLVKWMGNVHFLDALVLEKDSVYTILSVIAGASVTVTSITFSITMLILALVSQQLGPRLIPNFMRQGRTQFVLGFFIATFVYCLTVLAIMSLSHAKVEDFYSSVILAVFFGVLMFFVLIFFIHYVCVAIQVDTVLSYLSRETVATIKRVLSKNEDGHTVSLPQAKASPEALKREYLIVTEITSNVFGYIQVLDCESLLSVATKYDVVVECLYRPGHHITSDLVIFNVYSKKELTNELKRSINNSLQVSKRRSVVQDLEYGFEQISEIAVKALSPSVNDPYTAINCLDELAHIITVLNKYRLNPSIYHDKKDKIRVVTNPFTYESIVGAAFDQIRQEAKHDAGVAIHFIDIINKLLTIDLIANLKSALRIQAQLLADDFRKQGYNKKDLDDFEKRVCFLSDI